MSDTKHTAAAWLVGEWVKEGRRGNVVFVRGQITPPAICTVHNRDRMADLPSEEDDANAQLISAAPELLAACEAALLYFEAEALYHMAMPLLRVAIAKAKEDTADA